ncbi:MAG: hypothetical protein ACRD4O_11615 [Bryobacteraceae bacterium]
MEAHTPKRLAIERFLKSAKSEQGSARDVRVRVIDEKENPIVRLETVDASGPVKGLDVHTRQVVLENDGIDQTTKQMIRRWLASL